MDETTRTDTLGTRLARAIAAKDEAALRGVLADRFDPPTGSYVAEQQAYYRGDDTIAHLRMMCSGFRPT